MEFIHFGFELFDLVVETIEFFDDAPWTYVAQELAFWSLDAESIQWRHSSQYDVGVAFHGLSSFTLPVSRSTTPNAMALNRTVYPQFWHSTCIRGVMPAPGQ